MISWDTTGELPLHCQENRFDEEDLDDESDELDQDEGLADVTADVSGLLRSQRLVGWVLLGPYETRMTKVVIYIYIIYIYMYLSIYLSLCIYIYM